MSSRTSGERLFHESEIPSDLLEWFEEVSTDEYPTQPCLVCDPFCGSGTTCLVAERLGRDSIGIDLNPDYLELAKERIKVIQPKLNGG